jgi:hypothetical protein
MRNVTCTGSERADKTGATDERLKEAMSINKCVEDTHDRITTQRMTSGASHPARSSAITRLAPTPPLRPFVVDT